MPLGWDNWIIWIIFASLCHSALAYYYNKHRSLLFVDKSNTLFFILIKGLALILKINPTLLVLHFCPYRMPYPLIICAHVIYLNAYTK